MTDGASSSNKPRTRQRTHKPPPELAVPDIEQDAAERKRVLNVLAQRRYREKMRERRLAKESKGKTAGGNIGSQEDSSAHESFMEDSVDESNGEAGSSTQNRLGDLLAGHGHNTNLSQWIPLDGGSLPLLLPDAGRISDLSLLTDSDANDEIVNINRGTTSAFPDIFSPLFNNSPQSSIDNMSNSSADMEFPDTFLLPVHELTLLKGMLRIAARLGCNEELWSLDARSPFHQGVGTPAHQLPIEWRPTSSQILIPHHPLLDFLPWPSTRDKIISIFSLPDEARPPNAAGPLALANLAWDMEDSSEGVRIYGTDPCDSNSWEVGQVFFERWWFLFDRDIIANSNRWRQLRGAPPLTLKGSNS